MNEERSIEGARDTLGQSIDGYRSSFFSPGFTGVDATMWITIKNLGDFSPVARVEYPRNHFVAITLETEPRIIGTLPLYIRSQVRRWVQQNLSVLLDHWDGKVSSSDAMDQLKPLVHLRDIEKLTQSDREFLVSLNTRLQQIQERVRSEAERVVPELRRRSEDDSDPLVDFEIEFTVTYHLRRDDPEWVEDDDNILIEQQETATHILDGDSGFFGSFNWNDMQVMENHPLRLEYHCWLYHDLYDHHHHLNWTDLLRIGWIWLDMHVIYQYIEELEDGQHIWGDKSEA